MLKVFLVGLGGFFGSACRYLVSGWAQSLAPFSSFGLESYSLLQEGTWGRLAGNLLASVLGGLAAVWIGQILARSLS